jgi:hypothetical protein
MAKPKGKSWTGSGTGLGEYFGYRDGESLFTYFGKEVGRFDDEEIHGSKGRCLGEAMS